MKGGYIMNQTYTSADTSVNKNKLPTLYSKVDFSCIPTVIDWGCGKFNNGKQFIEQLGKRWFGYDPYNRSEEENGKALYMVNGTDSSKFCILCSNVLNVIDSDRAVQDLADCIRGVNSHYFISVYEGDKSGQGRVTKKDCYQRNERISAYLRYFPGAVLYKGVITNAPWLVK